VLSSEILGQEGSGSIEVGIRDYAVADPQLVMLTAQKFSWWDLPTLQKMTTINYSPAAQADAIALA
jgi:hypothetical protein